MDTYLLWALAHQSIAKQQSKKMPEDEFYTQFGRDPGRFSRWIWGLFKKSLP